MASDDVNLADRSGSLLESHKGYDPRVISFYFILAALLLTLVVGLAYQQLRKVSAYADAERKQNQRRILYPGPRGNIEDRNGKLLVGNLARFSVRLLLDELKIELRREQIRIRNNYRAVDDKDMPSHSQLVKIARVSVVQRYLNQVNAILGRDEKVDADEVNKHFARELLLPYTLLDDLKAAEYARLLERLPVNSPAQVYTSSTRHYPYGSAASHTLGYVGPTEEVELEDFPGADLKTFKMKGTVGRDGIEKRFDDTLQGEAGGAIFRVDPTGNRINPPLQQVFPKQGKNLRLSLDIDLQVAAEATMTEFEMAGAAVALDIATGEVLVLASKPDYNLTDFSPRISTATWADAQERGALFKRSFQGLYPPGSTFKILTTIAGFRSGHITTDTVVNCPGYFSLGRQRFDCHATVHNETGLVRAIEKSCNVFFYTTGHQMGPDIMAAEAKRFHLDRPTDIELLHETHGMIVPSPEWLKTTRKQNWVGGETVTMAIGQSMLVVSPLQMACFMASVARNEVWTQPTLLHDPNRPRQHTEPIGISREQHETILAGLEQVTLTGTGKILTDGRLLPRIPGLRIGAKTGTAQKQGTARGTINIAWIVAFAPVENPQIAIAVAIEGDTPGEETGGGRYGGPIAHAILKAWADKKNQSVKAPSKAPVKEFQFKTE